MAWYDWRHARGRLGRRPDRAFAKTGQYDAFEQVHRRNHRPLVRYLVAKVRHRQSAEDIAQEAWTKVVLALRNGTYQVRDDATFRTFLHRVADNCRIDAFRRENIRAVGNQSIDDGDEVADPATVNDTGAEPANDPTYALHRRRLLERFEKFLKSLSPEQHETAGLYLMGYTREEIAERTGWVARRSRAGFAIWSPNWKPGVNSNASN